MSYHLTGQAERTHMIDFRMPAWIARWLRRVNAPEAEQEQQVLRRELERMRVVSSHLLADIGIDCAAHSTTDDLVRQANERKSI